jgi:hypothetical protein
MYQYEVRFASSPLIFTVGDMYSTVTILGVFVQKIIKKKPINFQISVFLPFRPSLYLQHLNTTESSWTIFMKFLLSIDFTDLCPPHNRFVIILIPR